MVNNIISIGGRTASVKNMKSSLSSLGVSALILSSDLSIILNKTMGSIRHHLNKLQEKGIINHPGQIKEDIGKC